MRQFLLHKYKCYFRTRSRDYFKYVLVLVYLPCAQPVRRYSGDGSGTEKLAMAARVFMIAAIFVACVPLRGDALPMDLDEWGSSSISGILQDFTVGTAAAAIAEGASAPLGTLKALLQDGSGFQSLHSKAVELLDTKGRPVKERGVIKMVHVPLSPAQTMARIFGTGVLAPVGQAAASVSMGAVMVIFTRLAPALVRMRGWSDTTAGLLSALLAALFADTLVAFGTGSTCWNTLTVGLTFACRAFGHVVAAEMLRRDKEAEAWDARTRWSTLKSSTLLGFEGAGGRAVAVGVLHSLIAAGSLPFESRGGRRVEANQAGAKGASKTLITPTGLMTWGPLKVFEFAVRGCVMHYLLMRGHVWLRGTGEALAGLGRTVPGFERGVSGVRRRDAEESDDAELGGNGVREVGFRTLEQAKKQRVGEHEILVFDVPYDDEIGVDLPQVCLQYVCTVVVMSGSFFRLAWGLGLRVKAWPDDIGACNAADSTLINSSAAASSSSASSSFSC